ncbi:hypothetical protein LTR49_026846 [Elasticomyces elasticus]|nr:hypothetical protein LTR49_026846 [Elasticomyces elasticus]
MPGSYDEMDARQERERDIASIPGGKEASSPTKRRCLKTLDAESSGNRELAKIIELTETDFSAIVESDNNDSSRFRYYGALASTSDRPFSVPAIMGIDWQRQAVEQCSITRRPDAGAENGVTCGDRAGQM